MELAWLRMRVPSGARLLAVVVMLSSASACDSSEQALRRADRITICHATGSASNPFVQQQPDVDGILNGHDGHPGDIIPAFDFLDNDGNSQQYPGKNLDQLDILSDGCNVPDAPATDPPAPEPAPTDPPPTEPAPTEPPPTEPAPTTSVEESVPTTSVEESATTVPLSPPTTSVEESVPTVPSGPPTTSVTSPLNPPVAPEDPAVLDSACADCPPGPSISPADTAGIVYEVEPAGPWVPGQTVTVVARLVGSDFGFAEPLPPGWSSVDPSTAEFVVTFSSVELAQTGTTSVLPQVIAAAIAVALGSLLLVIGARRSRL